METTRILDEIIDELGAYACLAPHATYRIAFAEGDRYESGERRPPALLGREGSLSGPRPNPRHSSHGPLTDSAKRPHAPRVQVFGIVVFLIKPVT